jgi:uncharacterized protein YaeQ
MAQTATIYNLDIDLSDVDRSVYEKFTLCVARHPSETLEYMLMRVLAYCLEFGDGIALTEGVSAGDEPAVLGRDLTGRITAWIEVGMPDAARLHRGSKLAGRAAVYTHHDVGRLLSQLSAMHVHRVADIPVYEFERAFIDQITALLQRRSRLAITITERELYFEIDGRTFTMTILEHRVPN